MEKFIYTAFSLPSELCDDININNDLNKFLFKEFKDNIQKYRKCIDYYECNNYNNIINISYNNPNYFLNKVNNKNYIISIWALEDGEIIFWKKNIVQVKKGDIIIFPNSWTFPFEMNFKFIS